MVTSKWEMNTNLHAAISKILQVAIKGNVPQEEMPQTLLILSDMQFDSCTRYDDSAMQMIERKYAQAGYTAPSVVFWNLNSSGNAPVKADKSGAALVSGFSPSIMASLLGADPSEFTPEGNFAIGVISIDTKKKELIGNFSRDGTTFTQKAIETLDHDFPSAGEGKLIPHGIYDIARNEGHLNLNTSHDTSEFCCDSIAHWWRLFGCQHYPKALTLLILCDGGGSNASRSHLFKEALIKLGYSQK